MRTVQAGDNRYSQRFAGDDESLKEWVEMWAKEMVDIWKAKVKALGTERDWWVPDPIRDTRTPDSRRDHEHLEESIDLVGVMWNDPEAPLSGFTVTHTFNRYGLFVDSGSGREMGTMIRDSDTGQYLSGQKGMKKTGAGKWTTTRQPKQWFSGAYWRSCHALLEEANDDYSGNFVWLMQDLRRAMSMRALMNEARGR